MQEKILLFNKLWYTNFMKYEFKKIKYKHIIDIEQLEINENAVAMVGKSGSGKSTLLRIMANIISADSGDCFIDDKNIADYNPVTFRRLVTLMNQKPIIYSGSIKDNLIVGLIYQTKDIPDVIKLKEMLELFNIRCELESSAKCLSLGEQQRICMIRALLLQSKVYLLDEPTSSLDKETEDIVMATFFDIAKSMGSQIIFVTHNSNVAEKYAERIIKVEGGKICEYH